MLNEQPVDQLRSELVQYFLLVAYQGYSHQFSLRLTNAFIYLLCGAFGSSAALALYALLC